jgi:hypothetical protein
VSSAWFESGGLCDQPFTLGKFELSGANLRFTQSFGTAEDSSSIPTLTVWAGKVAVMDSTLWGFRPL